jgi:hypothetical protein
MQMNRNRFVALGFGAVLALGLAGYGCGSGESTPGTGTGGKGGATVTTGQGGSTGTGSGGSTGAGSGGSIGSGGSVGAGGSTSTGGSTGAGGATATGGSTGTGGATATGGSTGTGGATGTGGSTGGVLLCASPAPSDGDACVGASPSCSKNCGVNLALAVPPIGRATKLCTCSSAVAGTAGTWSCPSNLGACMYPAGADLTCYKLPATPPMCPGAVTSATVPAVPAPAGLIVPGTTTCTGTCAPCGSASATVYSYQDSKMTAKKGYCVCVGGVYQCASVNEWPVVP